jgi:hypothetical protein
VDPALDPDQQLKHTRTPHRRADPSGACSERRRCDAPFREGRFASSLPSIDRLCGPERGGMSFAISARYGRLLADRRHAGALDGRVIGRAAAVLMEVEEVAGAASLRSPANPEGVTRSQPPAVGYGPGPNARIAPA